MSKGSCNLEVIRDVYMRLIQHSCVDTIYGRAATMCDTQREKERKNTERTDQLLGPKCQRFYFSERKYITRRSPA